MREYQTRMILGSLLCVGLLMACRPSSSRPGPLSNKSNSDSLGIPKEGNPPPLEEAPRTDEPGDSEEVSPPGNISGSGFDRANGGTYFLKNLDSKKCLGVENQERVNNAAILLQTCDDLNGSQKFTINPRPDGYFQIVNAASGKVVELRDQQTGRGTVIQQNDSFGTDTQLFQIIDDRDKSFRIRVKGAPAYIDVEGRSDDDGAVIHVWDFRDQDNQLWLIVPVI